MTLSEKPLRVAICGARGVGQVHARIFHALGADVCAVLGSSDESAADAAHMLKESLGIRTQPFSRIEELLEVTRLDAVSICTPPHLHFEEILAAFDHNIPVFCEKPLFWDMDITRAEVEKKLAHLERHVNRRLFVNTSNASFVDSIVAKIGKQQNIHSFFFRFYTQNSYVGREIAIELLPHGFSLLLRLLGPMKIRDLIEDIGEHTYCCRFRYGDSAVEFDFQEIPGGQKALAFAINGRKFLRIQEGYGVSYRVFLKDRYTEEKMEVQDPFYVYIERFLDYCSSCTAVREDEFDEAAANLRLMADILLRGEKRNKIKARDIK